MPPVAFAKTSEPLRFDKKLGLCFGWLCFSKKAGEDYVDAHGDHFPDDELLKAVDVLMARPAAEREINVEHVGEGRGSIATAQALTEDVAKALGCDTGGTYGVIGSFRPDAELLKSIEAGDMFCLSIEGTASDVEAITKSALAKGKYKHKRTMRSVDLTKLAVVKAGAHEGARVELIKAAVGTLTPVDKTLAGAKKWLKKAIARHERHMDGTEATDDDSQKTMMDEMRTALEELGDEMSKGALAPIAARTPAATSVEMGHQHAIHDVDEKDGYTSWETEAGGYHGHSHSWLRDDDGTIVILVSDGHTHTIATEISAMSTPDIAKAQADIVNIKADFAKREGVLKALLFALVALPVEQAAFAKRLPPGEVEGFLAKTDAERAALATPVFKSVSTGECFYASDDARLVTMAKAADATAVELAKAREAGEVARFEKAATDTIPHWPGTLAERAAVVKAVMGIADEATRTVALEKLKAANVAFESITKRVGHNTPLPLGGSALEAFDKGLEAFAKAAGKSADQSADDFLSSPEGQRLYKAYEEETAAQRRVAH